MARLPKILLALACAFQMPAAAIADEAATSELPAPARTTGTPPFTLASRSEGSGPIALAEIRLKRGYPNGESWCPPDIDWETEICLGSSIVIAPGRVIRRLGASDDLDPQWNRRKFKYIGGHAIRWAEGGHWVAIIEQTDQDYWYVQWKAPIRDGRFCIHPRAAEFYGMASDLAYTSDDDGSRCYSLREAKRR